MAQSIVCVSGLEKWFEKNQVIKGIDFTIERGRYLRIYWQERGG